MRSSPIFLLLLVPSLMLSCGKSTQGVAKKVATQIDANKVPTDSAGSASDGIENGTIKPSDENIPAPKPGEVPLSFEKTLALSLANPLNPLKGFLPFSGSYSGFPHSMEFFYMPLNQVVKGNRSYDFSSLESELNAIAGRKHQAVFRFYLSYPSVGHGVPQYLIDAGLNMISYTDYGGGLMPDYQDARLYTMLDDFLQEFARRYDGDPRIAFIFTGLIGHWGEWHTYPRPELMPSEARQEAVLQSFDNAFQKTRILTRKPASYLSRMDIGLHDDSFAFETLPTQSWHFVQQTVSAGLTNKWQTTPIGGELRPEIQQTVWDSPRPSDAEDFDECVRQTKASWMLAHQLFNGLNSTRQASALRATASLGYDFIVEKVHVDKYAQSWTVKLTIKNRGVAPFYYNWTPEIALGDLNTRREASGFNLSSLLPGQSKELTLKLALTKSESKALFLRFKNPLSNGIPLRFSHPNQDQDHEGWLSLGTY